ncbi:MAG: phospholipase [Chitinophagaceae bacterium]|nr:MAG: phospholipase [Chitinophagaceae bacterium]
MSNQIILTGPSPEKTGKALVLVHGRGGTAADILSLATELPVGSFTLAAPEAASNTWYPYSFLAPKSQNQPALDQSLETLAATRRQLNAAGVDDSRIYWLGFSQGACLTLEYTTRNAARFGGIVAFTGGLLGPELDTTAYSGDFQGTPVLIASSDPDPHVPVERVQVSSVLMQRMGADVLTKIFPGMGHTITRQEIDLAVSHVFERK